MSMSALVTPRETRIRFTVIAMLFLVSAASYGDRVALSIAGISFSRDLRLDPVHLGYLFSAFSWAYVVAQLPAGTMLDRYGCKLVYGASIVCFSILALCVGFAGYLAPAIAFGVIFAIRLLSGLAQAPVFPGNGRIVAAWFPATERGRASAIFNSSQYFAVVLFAPIMGLLTKQLGWKTCFYFLGLVGLMLAMTWRRVIHSVRSHPRMSEAEAEHIERGGGLCSIEGSGPATGARAGLTWAILRKLLSHRLLVGIYLGQFCITTLTWFFLTWFPVYLSTARHMSIVHVGFLAALPALCGFLGGISGGFASDKLLQAGRSLTFSRKTPIVLGMLLATTMILCNYVQQQWLVVGIMSVAFFGKGFGALGWPVIADTSPVGMTGLNGGVFNLIGNMAGITTPILIGFLLKKTGSFNAVLIYVGCTALTAIFSYLVIAGPIYRLDAGVFQDKGRDLAIETI